MPIDIRGMAPLLQVFDMRASLSFYRDLLGFKVVEQSPGGDDCGWALLRLNEIELMLNTAYEKQDRPSAPDPARVLHHDDTALYFGCPDIDAAYSYFHSKSVNLKKAYITSYGFTAIDITDPDGYHLCFHWPVSS